MGDANRKRTFSRYLDLDDSEDWGSDNFAIDNSSGYHPFIQSGLPSNKYPHNYYDVDPIKKQNITRDPIIITTTHVKPSIRLFVFDQVFHVSSGALQQHSAFFRKFLKPGGGILPISADPLFKSDWFTQIDDGLPARWCLASDPKIKDSDLSALKDQSSFALDSFKKFLYVIFDSHYFEIKSVNQLAHMVCLADYYCALPKLSAAMDDALASSPNLRLHLHLYPCQMLVIARKLRHREMFHDAFIYALGPWSKPKYRELKEMEEFELYDMASLEYSRIKERVLKAQTMVLQECDGHHINDAVTQARASWSNKIYLPAFFRYCLPAGLKCLMTNNLKLGNCKAEAGVGVGPHEGHQWCDRPWSRSFKDRFLCFEVKKFPWNELEKDW